MNKIANPSITQILGAFENQKTKNKIWLSVLSWDVFRTLSNICGGTILSNIYGGAILGI